MKSCSVGEVVSALKLKIITCSAPDRLIEGVYTGDLLSWVMSRAEAGECWITIMTNINIVAVASLKELPLVIMCDGSYPNDDVIAKANEQGVNLAYTDESSYAVCVALAALLQ